MSFVDDAPPLLLPNQTIPLLLPDGALGFIQKLRVNALVLIGRVGPETELLPPLNIATVCGSSPLHTPSRLDVLATLRTLQFPGCALGAKFDELKTPRL
jgi:hypothetical protein